MLNQLKTESNLTTTVNGAAAFNSTYSDRLDLFASIGSMRSSLPAVDFSLFTRAYSECPDYAVKILFYSRDIREGLGERDVFRNILHNLARSNPESVIKNIPYIAEYGRFDDLLALFSTPCEAEMLRYISELLKNDIKLLGEGKNVSLLAKWLPSVNCSDYIKKERAKQICRFMKISEKEYRKTLSALRKKIDIIETHLCSKDYTFPYENVPSNANFKYHNAFLRNDQERYMQYLDDVRNGRKKMNESVLFPYQVVRECLNDKLLSERKALDAIWESLKKSIADEIGERNALAVVDGSGSMYWNPNGLRPIEAAISLGILFAELTQGEFHNHFITFSENPHLIEIKGEDIYEKVRYCMAYDDIANTNIERTFNLILKTAVENKLPQSELPEYLYIISDMQFDCCAERSDKTVFQSVKRKFEFYGYKLPQIVFWNVNSFYNNYPVTMNESGAMLLSGSSANLFRFCIQKNMTPLDFMNSIICSQRYEKITA